MTKYLRNVFILCSVVTLVSINDIRNVSAEPIYHEKYYPDGAGPLPAVIVLHTSGGFKTIKHLIQRHVDAGFAVYAPDFFRRHGLTPRTRMQTFDEHREKIEKELTEIVELMKTDKKISNKNVFAVGYSNGGFWVCYLTGTGKVRAGVSHYGVWKANMGREISIAPNDYFSKDSSPLLALHGDDDDTQKLDFAETVWDWIKDKGAKLETHVYEGANHAWDNVLGRHRWPYNEEVDKDAHKRTIAFFKKHMR
ncbi:MAG: dienelactone hydrolase family protein [Pseudomonadota bacterium]|nr:dienelactone hydrolase family protein [Pseudomonadota bacterium]